MANVSFIDVKTPSLEEMRADIVVVVNEEFGLTIPAFLQAVKEGRLDANSDAVRDVLLWLSFIPNDDPLFTPCQSMK